MREVSKNLTTFEKLLENYWFLKDQDEEEYNNIKRDLTEESQSFIKNKLGYLKNAINSNLNRIKNMPDDLYSDDEYDWLNDEEDFEL